MDPSYTSDIEHLVFRSKKRNPNQVAPEMVPPTKTRSRLAEMFALSRHLQQRSADKEVKTHNLHVNRSVDRILESQRDRRAYTGDSRWAAEEPVHAPRVSPNERDMATTRGPNVSVIHLRSTSEPWETSPTSAFGVPSSSSRSCSFDRVSNTSSSASKRPPTVSEINSSYKQYKNQWKSEGYSTESYSNTSFHRELSPVRWCDREVDGVFLGKSGWVQVQHRSLDGPKRVNYSRNSSFQSASARTGLKLAQHQYTNYAKFSTESTRPLYLPLKKDEFDTSSIIRTPSPVDIPLENSSPPSVTPIISPPLAFQDRNKDTKARTFFSKAPFLPRSNAIIDSDTSPPPSPPPTWKPIKVSPTNAQNDSKSFSSNDRFKKIAQIKSLEDTSASRRSKFVQKHGESSSSSSSSMGFRSLDSCMPKRNVMPKLLEHTYSSIEGYEDADVEDNNSSSLNISVKAMMKTSPDSTQVRQRLSPSSRASRSSSRTQLRRSPVGSDAKPTSPGSSSSSSNEYLYKSGARRTPPRQLQDDARVRRSRSLQLPEYNKDAVPARISPQRTEVLKIRSSNSIERAKKLSPSKLEQLDLTQKEIIREAEAVKEYLYGTRSRAAAQALLSQRYIKSEENKAYKSPESYNFQVVDSSRNKVLHRGVTTPNLGGGGVSGGSFARQVDVDSRKKVDNYKSQALMRSSKSYPSHQISLEVAETQILAQEPYKKRVPRNNKVESAVKRLSPSRNLGVDQKTSPQSLRSCTLVINKSSSSSSCDAFIIPCKPKNIKIYKGADLVSSSNEVTQVREVILTRPGSAPGNENKTDDLTAQQRSMSLPKSFLFKGGAMPWKKRGTESASSSPSSKKKTDTPQTAPVTPMHEANRRRSSKLLDTRRGKASSITHLVEPTKADILQSRKSDNEVKEQNKEKEVASNTTESVLQKFRKSFSLHFQKKNSRDNCSTDNVENLSDIMGESSDEDLQNVPASPQDIKMELEPTEQKHRFGPLSWRSNKNRKFASKVARSLKSTSGDSGINIEISTGSATNVGEDSSESHDTETPGEEFDSPPAVRRRKGTHRSTRPQSDLLNQILLDRFKAELKSRSRKPQHVRRANSDLGGRRSSGHHRWEDSTCSHFMSSPTSLGPRPQRPRKKPPDGPPGVQMRNSGYRHGQLRRSLSQPLDIDRLSPLLINKSNGIKMTGTKTVSEDEQDDLTSDSESSLASLGDRKKSLELPVDDEMVILAEAVFDHVAIDAEELAFRAGDVIEVIETVNRDWWWGSTDGKSGWFPADSVRLRVSQEDTVEDCLAAMASGKTARSQIRRRTSISLLSNDQVRTSVVRELVHTERDFVKVLQDVVEGYLSECHKRTDMFSEEQIKSIFINLEDILKFQTSFLRDLESNIDWEAPHRSCVGSCFIKHKHGFKIYSDYCNSHPLATATLQELYQFNNYSKFFEACRLMRGLIEIPLDGYLLTPVQRICKYPLQLAELLKYTKPEHEDYDNIKEAFDAMKEVAVLINERKRRMESLEKIAAWQQRVEAWEDDDLIDVSSQVIYQGEVVRVTTGMWTSNIILFLFDHQLVYCKKDILKRNTYIYKGRMCLDTSEVIDVPNGKDLHLGVSVRHAIKLYSCIRDKWLLVCCRSAEDKKRWLQAFEDERKFVNQDKSEGLEFTPSLRQLAKVAARSQRRPPRKLRSNNNKNYKRDSSYMGSTLQLHAPNFNSLGRKVGTWFTFGGKKTRHRELS